MFGCDGIPDHTSWNEVFHYRDTKLSCVICVHLKVLKNIIGVVFIGLPTPIPKILVHEESGISYCRDPHHRPVYNFYSVWYG